MCCVHNRLAVLLECSLSWSRRWTLPFSARCPMAEHDPIPPADDPPVVLTTAPFLEQQLAWLQGQFAPAGSPTPPLPVGDGETTVEYLHAVPRASLKKRFLNLTLELHHNTTYIPLLCNAPINVMSHCHTRVQGGDMSGDLTLQVVNSPTHAHIWGKEISHTNPMYDAGTCMGIQQSKSSLQK